MATKNLARTPLEAGNTGVYQRVRRRQRRNHRHEAKAYCRRVRSDLEVFEETMEPVAPEHRDREVLWGDEMHADRVGAVYGWIESKIGHRWDDVYAEIRRRFDVRTLSGRHIVFMHLPQEKDFANGGSRYSKSGRLFLDADRVLRMIPHERASWRKRQEKNAPSVAEFTTWLAGRKVIRRGAPGTHAFYGVRYYWLVPSSNCLTKPRLEEVDVDR
ncbi:MAG: hypothetical protein Q7S02_00800, partial [bacterium]|nr:hypothetical protein [bacterium]